MIPSSQYFIYDDTHKSRLVSVASFLWIPFEALVRCKTYTMEAIRKMIDDSDVGISSTCSLHSTTSGREKVEKQGHLENECYTHLGEGRHTSTENYHFSR